MVLGKLRTTIPRPALAEKHHSIGFLVRNAFPTADTRECTGKTQRDQQQSDIGRQRQPDLFVCLSVFCCVDVDGCTPVLKRELPGRDGIAALTETQNSAVLIVRLEVERLAILYTVCIR